MVHPRRAAIAAAAASSSALHFAAPPRQRSVARHLYAPAGSGYVLQDEDEQQDRFRDWPADYVPDLTYNGTCVPGTARDNAPLADLTNTVNIAPHAFFEAPFHARLPANHPASLSPWERLEKAGRFIDDDDDVKVNKPRKQAEAAKQKTKVEAVESNDLAKEVVAKDPLFADDASDLLDAALGLDEAAAPADPAAAAVEAPEKGADEWLLD